MNRLNLGLAVALLACLNATANNYSFTPHFGRNLLGSQFVAGDTLSTYITSPTDGDTVYLWNGGFTASIWDTDAIAWTSDDSLNSALVPAEALQAMLAAAGSWRG